MLLALFGHHAVLQLKSVIGFAGNFEVVRDGDDSCVFTASVLTFDTSVVVSGSPPPSNPRAPAGLMLTVLPTEFFISVIFALTAC